MCMQEGAVYNSQECLPGPAENSGDGLSPHEAAKSWPCLGWTQQKAIARSVLRGVRACVHVRVCTRVCEWVGMCVIVRVIVFCETSYKTPDSHSNPLLHVISQF